MAAAATSDPKAPGQSLRPILSSNDDQTCNSLRVRTVTSCAPTDSFHEWRRNCASGPHGKLTSRLRKMVTPRAVGGLRVRGEADCLLRGAEKELRIGPQWKLTSQTEKTICFSRLSRRSTRLAATKSL